MDQKEKYHYLYQVTNLIDGKIYVGVRSCIGNPNEDDYMGSGIMIKRAIEKYGLENFKKEILEFCNSREELHELEKCIVDKDFVEDPNTYNLTGGGWGRSYTTDETKQKISIRNKLRSLESRKTQIEGMRKANIGHHRPHKEATKQKIRDLQLHDPNRKLLNSKPVERTSELTKLKMSLRKIGTTLSDKHKQSISKALKGQPLHPNTLKALIGRVLSEESKKKQSENIKKAKALNPQKHSEEEKQHLREIMTGRNITWGDKISSGLKTRWSEKKKIGTGKKIVCDNNNMEFKTIAEAAKYYDVHHCTIVTWLNNPKGNKQNIRWKTSEEGTKFNHRK